jgi:hypothetical protein
VVEEVQIFPERYCSKRLPVELGYLDIQTCQYAPSQGRNPERAMHSQCRADGASSGNSPVSVWGQRVVEVTISYHRGGAWPSKQRETPERGRNAGRSQVNQRRSTCDSPNLTSSLIGEHLQRISKVKKCSRLGARGYASLNMDKDVSTWYHVRTTTMS